jgi:hypothetical protein
MQVVTLRCKAIAKDLCCMQVQGLGTALKILFSDRKHGPLLHLSRMELVALFNVLERYMWLCVWLRPIAGVCILLVYVCRFSSSIHFLEVFREIQVTGLNL